MAVPIDPRLGVASQIPGRLLYSLNRPRRDAGLQALVPHPLLQRAAQAHAAALVGAPVPLPWAPRGIPFADRARQAGYSADALCWSLPWPRQGFEAVVRGLLLEEGLLLTLLNPRTQGAGIALQDERLVVALGAPFILDVEGCQTRIFQILNHARTRRGLAPLVVDAELTRLAHQRAQGQAPPGRPADLPEAVPTTVPADLIEHGFDTAPVHLTSHLREALETPDFGAAVREAAQAELGIFVEPGGTRCQLLLRPR